MKLRLLTYLILFPLVLMVTFTNMHKYLAYIAYACIPVIIGLLIYAYIKTKAFYKINKCLFFIVFGLLALTNISPSYAQSITQQLLTQRTAVRQTIEQLTRKNPRTTAEERQLQQAVQKYSDLQKQIGIIPCPSSQELYKEAIADCWACDVANLFIEAGDKVATSFYKMDKEQGYATSLLIIGFMFWLITHVLKLLMSFGVGDIGRFFTELFTKMLLVGGIFILLLQPMQKVVDFAVSPFFLLSASISNSIANTAKPLTDALPNKMDEILASKFSGQLICPYCNALANNNQSLPDRKISEALNYNARADERVVSPVMRNALLCTVCTVYRTTVPTSVTGQLITCAAKKKTETVGGVKIYTDWGAVITGYTLIFSFFLISALFAFYLIDTFLRIAITLVLLPFLITAWAFESTRQYTKKGFEVLLHAVATYIMIALLLTLIVQIFYVMLGSDASQIATVTANNDVDKLVELTGWGGSKGNGGRIFLSSIGILIIAWFCLGKIDEYVSGITGIGLNNSGGFQAMQTTIGAGLTAAKTISKIYDKEWKRPSNDTGISPEDKAAKIRQWGEEGSTDGKDGEAEHIVDEAAASTEQGIRNVGNTAAEGIEKAGDAAVDGAKALFKVPYVGAVLGTIAMAVAIPIKVGTKAVSLAVKTGSAIAAKVSKIAVKYGGRLMVKTARHLNPAKMIALNKYFNKTVGAAWQFGEDIYNLPEDIKKAKEDINQKTRNAKAAYLRYKRRRRKSK